MAIEIKRDLQKLVWNIGRERPSFSMDDGDSDFKYRRTTPSGCNDNCKHESLCVTGSLKLTLGGHLT